MIPPSSCSGKFNFLNYPHSPYHPHLAENPIPFLPLAALSTWRGKDNSRKKSGLPSKCSECLQIPEITPRQGKGQGANATAAGRNKHQVPAIPSSPHHVPLLLPGSLSPHHLRIQNRLYILSEDFPALANIWKELTQSSEEQKPRSSD